MKDIKIEVVDEHHEALLFWEDSMCKKRIKEKGTLIHTDFHSDLGVPNLKKSVYSKNLSKLVQDSLNIDNFIIPAILRDIFKDIIFLNPLDQNKKRKKMIIGTVRGKGKVIVKIFKKEIKKLFPDAKEFYLSFISNSINIPKKREITLDIDMDYFSCNLRPQSPLFIELTDKQLRKINHFSKSNDKYKIDLKFFNIKDNILKLNEENSDKNFVYNDSIKWIDYSIKSFVKGLKVKPKIISICRSVKSGFTPVKYDEYIEKNLIDYLKNPPAKINLPKISRFKIYPFVSSTENIIFNAFTEEFLKLNETGRFIWEQINKGKDFDGILKESQSKFIVNEERAKTDILNEVLNLRKKLILKCL